MSAAWRKEAGNGTTVCGVAVLLLIEDDAKIRTAMMRALTERGHAVASQPTGMAIKDGRLVIVSRDRSVGSVARPE